MIKAFELGIDPDEIKITCEAGRYSGKWIAWLPDSVREKYILTESHDVYELCWFKARLRMLRNGA